jgi:hypothetical protein
MNNSDDNTKQQQEEEDKEKVPRTCPPSFQSGPPARTAQEALALPQTHRDLALAHEPMPNYSSGDGKGALPLSFWASWALRDRPRRIALLLDDTQEEYRPFAEHIIPSLVALVKAFREQSCPVVWSSWARTFDDGISNAMDRWYCCMCHGACVIPFSSLSHHLLVPFSYHSHPFLISFSSPSHPLLIPFSSHSHLFLIPFSSPSRLFLIPFSPLSHLFLIPFSSPSHLFLILLCRRF